MGQNVILYTDFYKIVQSKPNSKINLFTFMKNLIENLDNPSVLTSKILKCFLLIIYNLSNDEKGDFIKSEKRHNVWLF